MDIIAIIPARGGSKGVPRKNIKTLAGKPLIAYTIEHALEAKQVSRVIVSTDSPEIADVSVKYGAEVIQRPPEICGDTATSEEALNHALGHMKNHGYQPDLVVFLQCTSPIRKPDDIDKAIETLKKEKSDSLLSVGPSRSFLWRKTSKGVESVNYDFRNRPRRQDRPQGFIENGSIYVFKPWVLSKERNRLGGKISLYQMDRWSSFEIDDPDDWALCEWIFINKHNQKKSYTLIPEKVELLVLDFDGVMTDNMVWMFQNGTEAVRCNRGDGMGLDLIKQKKIPVFVLSTETNSIVSARCKKLKIECFQSVERKGELLKKLINNKNVLSENMVYVGNDINDLECLRMAGCAVVPADSNPEAKLLANIVLKNKGGEGAVREVCDLILKRLSTNSEGPECQEL